ncbi:MAG: DUF885 domain-containing protein [Candidatus Eremiobacteraeota bacterium]|nr:DUF885 domain-containing protein [Candidatus Eremiobacteraeota bacterium]
MMRLRFHALVLACAAAVSLCGPAAASASPAGAQLQALYTKGLLRQLKDLPEVATFLGDYRYDAYWSKPGMAGIRQGQAMMRQFESSLDRINMSHATLRERNDMRLARAFVVAQNRQIAEALEGKDAGGPPLAMTGVFFTMLLHKDEQNPSVWWDHVISRMEKGPAWLAASKTLITHPGKLQGQVAQQQLAQAPALFTYILTPIASKELSAAKLARFTKARDALVGSLTAWNKWLADNAASWPENYAMGRAAYNKMLRDELFLPYDSDGIIRIGQATLDAAIADQNAILAQAKAKGIDLTNASQAASVGGGPTPTTKDAQFAFFQAQLDALQTFIRDNHIATIPAYVGRMKIETTPAFLQPVLPGPSMNSPPLLSKERDGVYFVPPPNPQMSTNPKFFEDFDRDRVLMTSGHEGFPGHFLQLSIAKHNPDAVRRFSFDGVFAEGWAFYEEALLRQMGLYGDDLDGRYAVAQFERLRGARAIVDAKLATGDWSFDQALKWFQQNAGVDAETARGEVSRHALGPGQAFDYAVGRAQILDLLSKYKAKKGAAFSLQAFHDDLLSHGTVPVAIAASEMLAE